MREKSEAWVVGFGLAAFTLWLFVILPFVVY